MQVKKFKLIAGIAGITGIIIFLGLLKIAFSIYQFGWKAVPQKSDVIIVLGCGLYGSALSPFLQARLEEGVRLFKEGYARNIIVSGGQGPDELISEASAMKNYLLGQGITPSHIFMEDQSTSTKENLIFSRKIMFENQFHSAIIVSNKFHLRRAAYFAQKADIKSFFSGVFVSDFKRDEVLKFFREILVSIRYGLF